MQPKRLFLLDGMALVYRAHFAFAVKPVVTTYGLNSSAILGFTNTLMDLLQKGQPTHLAVVFDTSAPTARHSRFPAYKAQRQEMPEDLSKAIPHVKRLIEAFRIPVLTLDGYEADDIIGTLAKQAESEPGGEWTTWMVTPDKDFAQLVDDRTFMWKPGRQGGDHEVIGVPEVQAQWLVHRPEQVIDVLGLWGDVSDNIPGVPGIGEKTAKALIAEYGSVENLLANTGKLKGKQKENLIQHAEQARLCRELATIQLDVPLDIKLDTLIRQPMDDEAVQALLVEFEFNALGRRLFGDSFKAGRGFHRRDAAPPADADANVNAGGSGGAVENDGQPVLPVMRTLDSTIHDYQPADTPQRRAKAVQAAFKAGTAALAVDWQGADPRSSEIRGIALCPAPGKGFYLTNAGPKTLVADLLPLLSAEAVTLTGHDLKEQLQVLMLHGAPAGIKARVFDTYIAQALVEADQKATLPYLTEALLGYTLSQSKPVEASGQMLMPGLEPEDTARGDRTMERADMVRQLQPLLVPKLVSAAQERVFYEIESPLIPVLAEMESIGIRLETSVLKEIGMRLEKEIRALEESVYAKAGMEFNLNSPKQLGEILFDRMKLVEKPKKTKTGQYMTSEDVLTELAGIHPIIADLLTYREASKLKSTYVDALPSAVSRRTGRVHTTLQQVSTATGRLASMNPNLQNIPIRTEAGRGIRRAFIAPGPGWSLLSADYSQVELRVMASISQDAHMMEAFAQGIDIHTATAARVHGVPLEEVTSGMRRIAKMVNFGIIYGISSFGLAQRLGIARSEGGRLIDEYFVQYPGVKRFMDSTILEAQKKGYVETLTGRRRYLRDINSGNLNTRKAAERTAINTPIQGTAADMIKIAMVRVAHALREGGFQTRMLLQVHDELLFEVPDAEREAMRSLIPQIMRDALPLSVPILVEIGEGPDWHAAHA